MLNRLGLAACALFLAASVLTAQDVSTVMTDFREIVLRKTGTAEARKQRNEDMQAWYGRAHAMDLGEHAFALDVARYFLRQYDAAAAGLLAYHEKHGKFPTTDYNTIMGRIFLNGVMQNIRKGEFDRAAVFVDLAARYYNRPDAVYRYAGTMLKRADDPRANAMLITITTRVMKDKRLDDAARLAVLKGIYAPARRGRPAQPARATTFKTFTATTMDGRQVSPSDFKGKVLLIDFWATWCPPCMREMPHVVAVHRKYADQGFAILGISLDKAGAKDRIRVTAEKHGMTWPQIYDGRWWKAELAVLNGVRSIPATFLFDRTGKLRYTQLRGEELERRVKELLTEKPPAGERRNL